MRQVTLPGLPVIFLFTSPFPPTERTETAFVEPEPASAHGRSCCLIQSVGNTMGMEWYSSVDQLAQSSGSGRCAAQCNTDISRITDSGKCGLPADPREGEGRAPQRAPLEHDSIALETHARRGEVTISVISGAVLCRRRLGAKGPWAPREAACRLMPPE